MDDDIRIQSTMFGPNAPKEFDRAFLKRIVTSFLKTHMSAIVLGSDVALINTILHTLALFISPADRKRCRLAYHGAHIVMPEVRLQGILKDGTTQVSETILLEYTFPVTIIDLTENTVQHAPIYHEYLNVRNSFFFFFVVVQSKMFSQVHKEWNDAEHVQLATAGQIDPSTLITISQCVPAYLF